MSRLLMLGCAFALALSACAKEGLVTAKSEERTPPSIVVEGPSVSAGTRFVATLDGELATDGTVKGQPFTARVTRALRAADGTIVVPAGAVLVGRVTRVRTGLSPLVEVELSTIDTTRGAATLDAKLEQAPQLVVRRPRPRELGPQPGKTDAPSPPIAGSMAFPSGSVDSYSTGEPPSWGGYDFWDSLEVIVPAGSELTFELTRPIVPPGSRELR